MDDHAPEHAATVSQAMGSVTDFARAVMLLSEYVEVVRPPPAEHISPPNTAAALDRALLTGRP